LLLDISQAYELLENTQMLRGHGFAERQKGFVKGENLKG
jgi:hypothetical protein